MQATKTQLAAQLTAQFYDALGALMTLPRNNTSGYIGVGYNIQADRWRANIILNREHIHLGSFHTKAAAIRARKAGEKLYSIDILGERRGRPFGSKTKQIDHKAFD